MYKRIIPTLTIKDGMIVKSVQFDYLRPVSSPMSATSIFEDRGVDELILLHIRAEKPNYALIKDFADNCFMPLTIGGGIRTIQDIENALKAGADKVSIKTMSTSDFIPQAVSVFGSQCIVASIDYDGTFDVVEKARQVERDGAGEILLNSVSNDGMMSGFDIELIKEVSESVKIPVIALGGAGRMEDFKEAFDAGADAVSASSIFLFRNITPKDVKNYLKEYIKVRI